MLYVLRNESLCVTANVLFSTCVMQTVFMYDFQQIYFLQSKRLFKLTKEFFHDVFKPFFIIFEKLTCQEGLIGVIVDFIFFLPQK